MKPKINYWKCNKCNHEWISRLNYPPLVCARCKSHYWNKEKEK